MITRKSTATRKLRYIFIFIVVTSVLYLYYASSNSIDVKSTVFHIYNKMNQVKKSFINSANITKNPQNLYSTVILLNLTTSTLLNSNRSKLLLSSYNNKISHNSTPVLESCPIIPPNLQKRVKLNKKSLPIKEIENLDTIQNLNIKPGGFSKPKTCLANYRVAIIIPYRDRLENLQLFLNHMHPFLSKQQLEYGIYITEPIVNVTFNRGLLMNIGYNEANKDTKKWDCFVFHDVDLLPEDERNIYSCPEIPRHMSSAVSTMNYKIPYDAIFGGVVGFTKDHFNKINGFSNLYFGWGGEDDDLRNRVIKVGLSVARYPLEIGRYYMAKHKKDKPNPERFKLLNTGKSRLKKDGISSLNYTVIKIEKKPLFTRILVTYDQNAIIGPKKTKKT